MLFRIMIYSWVEGLLAEPRKALIDVPQLLFMSGSFGRRIPVWFAEPANNKTYLAALAATTILCRFL